MTLLGHRTLWVALGLRQGRAQHSPAEAAALARWARGRRALVEVGVAEGASAAVLRRVMDPDGQLWLVDPFQLSRNPFFNSGLAAARRTVRDAGPGRVHFVVARSLDAAAGWVTGLDFVFIDADHGYDAVLADWRAWSRHVVPGGIVAFHDAVPAPGHPPGPARAIDELFRSGATPCWTLVDEADTLVAVRRAAR